MIEICNVVMSSRDGEGDRIKVDPMEENDNDIIGNGGINRLIHDTFDAMDENAPVDDIYEGIHDLPLIDKA
jgi:hypothetical protein